MLKVGSHRSMYTPLLVSSICLGLGPIGFAHEGHAPSQPRQSAPAAHTGHQRYDERWRSEDRPAHGGQVTRGKYHSFEVVYEPRETRIYLYGPTQRLVSAQGVEGQVTMQVRGNPKVFRYPVQHVAPVRGNTTEDYLSIPVDVSKIRDGDMQVTFELAKLPFAQQEPQLRFTQVFALSRQPISVAIAEVTEADGPAIARQRICPVMDTALGEHGDAVKLMVGGEPLFLCCEDCVKKVQQNPEFYLRRAAGPAAQAAQTQHAPGKVTVTSATSADRQAIAAQRVCPVMNKPLGGHGSPLKVNVNGQSFYVCCRGCLQKVASDPDFYLSKAAQLRNEK